MEELNLVSSPFSSFSSFLPYILALTFQKYMSKLEAFSEDSMLAICKNLDTPSLLALSATSSFFYKKMASMPNVWRSQLTLFGVAQYAQIEKERNNLPKNKDCISLFFLLLSFLNHFYSQNTNKFACTSILPIWHKRSSETMANFGTYL